jgi:hypothetical protein
LNSSCRNLWTGISVAYLILQNIQFVRFTRIEGNGTEWNTADEINLLTKNKNTLKLNKKILLEVTKQYVSSEQCSYSISCDKSQISMNAP